MMSFDGSEKLKKSKCNFKILHKTYAVNLIVSKYVDADSTCLFCKVSNHCEINLSFKSKRNVIMVIHNFFPFYFIG